MKRVAANVVLPVRGMASPAEPSLFESVSVKLRKLQAEYKKGDKVKKERKIELGRGKKVQ
jgi:hypothetical protein